MGSNWPLIRLGDFVQITTGHPFKSNEYSETAGVKLLRGDNIVQGALRWQNVKMLPEDKIGPKEKNYYLRAGDVILAMDRPWIEAGLKTAQVNESDLPCLLVQRVACLRCEEQSDQDFIRYIISSYSFVQYVQSIQTGTAIPHISGKQIKDFEFRLPPKNIRKKIGAIIKQLDDKSHLNRQLNQTLEQMAQALFKSWFVDFDPVVDNALDAGFFEQDIALPDELMRRAEARRAVREQGDFKPLPDTIRQLFPAAFEECAEPSLGLGGWVPKGWQVQSIKDFANVTDFVANGSFAALKENVTLFDNPEYALYIRTTDFKNDFDKEKAKYIDKHAYEFLSKTKLSGAEVIISNVGDVGTVFRPPSWLGMPMTLGSNAIAISTQSLNDYLYFYFSSQAGQSAIDGIVSGSAQQKFNKTGFRSLRLLLPSNNVVIKFNEVYQDISSKIISNKKNVRHLELLRDTLLPKLISGELHLDNIDAELAKVDVA